MGKAQKRKRIIASGNAITAETVKLAGAIQPKDEDLPPAIIFGVQLQDIHDYKSLFMGSLQFINRGYDPIKYLFTTEQFDRVLQSLVDQENLVFQNGGYYLHPDIQKQIDSKSGKKFKSKPQRSIVQIDR